MPQPRPPILAEHDSRSLGLIRAALVGCGAVAWKGLIPAWLPEVHPRRPQPASYLDFGAAEGLAITVVCDPNPAALARARSVLPQAACFESWQDLLASRSEVEAMLIATPNQLHEPQVIAALRAGLHVFVEKPVASSRSGLDEICRLEQETRRVTMVHLPWRFRSEARALIAWVEAGTIGRIRGLYSEFRHSGPRQWSPGARWYYSKENAVGCLGDLGPHVLDLLSLLGGRPELTAVRRLSPHRIDCELRFADGIEGAVCTGWDRETPLFQIQVMGTQGTIVAHLAGPGRGIEVSSEVLSLPVGSRGRASGMLRGGPWTPLGSPPSRAAAMPVNPYEHFVASVRGGRMAETSVLRLRPVEELLLQALEMLKEGDHCA
jgi:predicted dehydrogenase